MQKLIRGFVILTKEETQLASRWRYMDESENGKKREKRWQNFWKRLACALTIWKNIPKQKYVYFLQNRQYSLMKGQPF